MNRTHAYIAGGLALTLVAGASLAAQAVDSAPAPPPPVQMAAGSPGQDQTTFRSTPMVVTADTAPPDQIRALAAGSNKLVTNGPIPDTPANRKLYGKPLSHAGRKSAPDGN
jgi:hypothetical protein